MKLSNRLGFRGISGGILALFSKKTLCMVVSEQESAEVWSNGQNTGLLTPCMVQVPINQTIEITLKKFAHTDARREFIAKEQSSFVYVNMARTPLKLILGGLSEPVVEKISAGSSR